MEMEKQKRIERNQEIMRLRQQGLTLHKISKSVGICRSAVHKVINKNKQIMKKQFTPIAMKCNQEQFDAIRPKLEKAGLKIFWIQGFNANHFLVLFEDGSITNGTITDGDGYIVYETWNENIFLEACGIEINESAKSNQQVKQYKHKPTGNIVNKSINGKSYYCDNWDGYYIPCEIVENSSDWEEVNQVLFITEDGIAICQGDKFWVVQDKTFDKMSCNCPLDNPEKWHTFSTEEKASEYILLNKPCLSVNDVKNIFKDSTDFLYFIGKLAKSKISDQQ